MKDLSDTAAMRLSKQLPNARIALTTDVISPETVTAGTLDTLAIIDSIIRSSQPLAEIVQERNLPTMTNIRHTELEVDLGGLEH
jgi:hypothetical protein